MKHDFYRALVIVLALLFLIGHIEYTEEAALAAYQQQ